MMWTSQCLTLAWENNYCHFLQSFFFIAFQSFTRGWNHSYNHSTQWFCSESPITISFHCEIGEIWWNGWQSQTVVCCVAVFLRQQAGTFRRYSSVITHSPLGEITGIGSLFLFWVFLCLGVQYWHFCFFPTLLARQPGLMEGWRGCICLYTGTNLLDF